MTSQNSHTCSPKNIRSFTKLLIYSLHKKILHGGVNSTLAALRQEYWVPSGRQYIKGLLRLCVSCKRHHGKPYPAPEPAPLPKDRLRETTPFTVTGVDFTGALYVRESSGESKICICLFACSTTRAIHLKVVTDLTVETFLLAFRRFVSLSRQMWCHMEVYPKEGPVVWWLLGEAHRSNQGSHKEGAWEGTYLSTHVPDTGGQSRSHPK